MGRAFEYRRAAKEKRWDKMSKLFPKLGKAITMAAKEGGSDPMTNAKLRTAIQNAKAELLACIDQAVHALQPYGVSRADVDALIRRSLKDFVGLAKRYEAGPEEVRLITDIAVMIDGIARKAGSPP